MVDKASVVNQISRPGENKSIKFLPLFWRNWCKRILLCANDFQIREYSQYNLAVLRQIDSSISAVNGFSQHNSRVSFCLGSVDSDEFLNLLQLSTDAIVTPEFWVESAAEAKNEVDRLLLLACHFATPIDLERLLTVNPELPFRAASLLAESLWSHGFYDQAIVTTDASLSVLIKVAEKSSSLQSNLPFRDLGLLLCQMLVEHGNPAASLEISSAMLGLQINDRAKFDLSIQTLHGYLCSFPEETRLKTLLAFAEACLEVDAGEIAADVLLGAIGLVPEDFAGLGHDLVPNQRTKLNPIESVNSANWLWILTALNAPPTILEKVLARPAGFRSLISFGVQNLIILPILKQRCSESQAQRPVSLTLSSLSEGLRVRYISVLLECLDAAGRFYDFAFILGAHFFPYAEDDIETLTGHFKNLPVEPSDAFKLISVVARVQSREPGRRHATMLLAPLFDMPCSQFSVGVDSEAMDCAIEQWVSHDRKLSYALVECAATAFSSEGRLSEARQLVHALLRIDQSEFLEGRLPRWYWCRYCQMGTQYEFFLDHQFSDLASKLSALIGVNASNDRVSTARQLFASNLFGELGLTRAGDLVITLAHLHFRKGRIDDAITLTQALTCELCMDFYLELTERSDPGEAPDGFFALYPAQRIRPPKLVEWACALSRFELDRNAADAAGAIEMFTPFTPSEGPDARHKTFKFKYLIAAIEFGGQPTLMFDACELLAKSLLAQGQSGPAVESLKHALHNMECLSSLPEFELFKQVLAPYRRLEFIRSCVETLPTDDLDFVPLCRSAVQLVQSLIYDEITSISDRKKFVAAASGLRDTLVHKLIGLAFTGERISAQEFLAWLEQLDNRLLLEDYLLKNCSIAEREATTGTPIQAWNWGISSTNGHQDWGNRQSLEKEYDAWYSNLSSGHDDGIATATALGFSDSVLDEGIPEFSQSQYLSKNSGRSRELFRLISRPVVLNELVLDDTIWLRIVFGHNGRLYWWAFADHTSHGSFKLFAKGMSDTEGAKQRLELANLSLDAELEAIWCVVAGTWVADSWQLVEFGSALKHAIGLVATEINEAKCEKLTVMCRTALDSFRAIGLANVAALGDAVLSWQLAQDEQEKWKVSTLKAWQRVVAILSDAGPKNSQQTRATNAAALNEWKDNSLNDACRRHRSAVTWETNFGPLQSEMQRKGVDPNQLNLVLTVDGPLHMAPISWVSFNERFLFEHFLSTRTSISLTLETLFQPINRTKYSRDRYKVLSAIWESPEARIHSRGLVYLHLGVHETFARANPNSQVASGEVKNHWKVYGLVDAPLLTPQQLEYQLRSGAFQVVVIGGHGHARHSGIALASIGSATKTKSLPTVTDESHESVIGPTSLWRGEGNFSDCDVIILCSCAVGRLEQTTSTDVSGLYTRIAANFGKAVIAAKWPIDDRYAAEFVIEFCKIYKHLRDASAQNDSTIVEVSFQKARRQLLSRRGTGRLHLLSAFELYGR